VKFAIDRYYIGIETEVDADDFDNQYYIPNRKERFFCPECNEIVYFRAKGGNHPNQFYHQEKNDRTPECDKRVDGRANLTLSQRVGLPIFLTGIFSGNFQLSIGFPALGLKTLESVAKSGCVVKISSTNQNRTLKIDQTNFLSESTTLVPVNFIPPNGKNYAITIVGDDSDYDLLRKWSDYADGFEPNGAIFSYSETGGKKIRRGDCISTHRYYYAVAKRDFLYHSQISQTEIGKLIISQTEYKVIKIKIDVSSENKCDFTLISSYVKSNFGVWLLECQPELIPVWPPVVQQDYMIPVNHESNVICVVSSGNTEPNVYTYSENSADKKDIKTTENNVHIVKLSVGKYPTILSVDRKYVGREVSFISKKLQQSDYAYDFAFINSDGEKIELSKIDEKSVSSGFILQSNSKFDLYIGTAESIFKHFSIRDKLSEISKIQGANEICLVIGSNVVEWIKFNKEVVSHEIIRKVSERILTSAKGYMMPIPIEVDYMLRYLKDHDEEQLYKSIISTIINDKIHIETVRQLRLLDLSIGITHDKKK